MWNARGKFLQCGSFQKLHLQNSCGKFAANSTSLQLLLTFCTCFVQQRGDFQSPDIHTYAARNHRSLLINFLSLNSIFCYSYHKYCSRIEAFMSKLMSEYKAEGTNTPFYTFACRSRKGSIGIHFPCSGGVTITLCSCRSHCFEGRRLQHPRPGFASNYAQT